jgi:hypothetical protein
VVKNEVLASSPRTDLRVHLVWVPILESDTVDEAQAAVPTVSDPRVHQYWDRGRQLATALGSVLGIPPRRGDAAASPSSSSGTSGLAWDVYLLYPREARWPVADSPPVPGHWMHQLNQVTPAQAPFLDGKELRRWIDATSP